MEQPFTEDDLDRHQELSTSGKVTVYADESIQDMAQLEARHAAFGGVNLKLMKCGGLDRAKAMAKCARELDLKVMLGSMSESSLGCTVMGHLAGMADIVDLDGPWLIANDPFRGIGMEQGRLRLPEGAGWAVDPVVELPWIELPS
jgi:L-alanine-DL-glutamate epimerase-like enolase superfamily enzyme